MKIEEVRDVYHEYIISYMPKKDYLIGITDTKIKKRRKDKYEDVFIARKNNKYWIIYKNTKWMTGHFVSREKAINWFKYGGR